MEGDRLLHLS